ncbi:hypothetical protein T440DRAFT_496514 [Plenodomus tracheiphilus IPT5]|uniref:NAD(P)-binding protein n=1 Tax=Plenodomus tracheiphilus IPT5 TaxID=1408161 RepID=A0A6A7BGN4_9PLEO|nr:hypothetical protein T440DRAFT_496514 [Plenodomus tracheiphilus IPT5]
MQRTLILFGSGPGIGSSIASAFATTTPITNIILLSRNTTRLQTTASTITSSHPNLTVSTLYCDLSDLASLPAVLSHLDTLTPSSSTPEIIYFNAARINPTDTVLSVPVQEIEEDFKTTNLALYLVAQHYLPRLTLLAEAEAKKVNGEGEDECVRPALLVTNSALPWDPVPELLSLSAVKASQKNMVENFARAWEGSGVRVGLVHVEGAVAPENKVLNPKTIAERTVAFWKEGEGVGLSIKEE